MDIERTLKEAPLAIFDFDGTIFNIEVNWASVYESLSMIGREHDHIGGFTSLRSAYEWAGSVYRVKECLIEVQNEFEEEGIPQREEVVQGVLASKWRLSRGLECAVLSLNTSYTLDRVIGHWGFYPMISIDKVTRPKPDPEGVDIILKAHMKGPKEAVFIGNSDIDRECAARGAVEFIHIDDIKEEWFI
jgi:phosphoglycolate phosphatase-like HAD superfamily hydrolase